MTGVIIPANSGLKPKIALANGKIGTTQSLAEMVKANNAVAAINGTFFSAYGVIPVPWNHLVKDGEVIHIGNTGSAFGFTKDGRVKLERLRIKINGGTDGSFKYPNNWYAFGVNHWPAEDGNLAYIFTSAWGKTLGFSHGTNIVVSNGIVTKIGENQDVEIPANGYVISLHGSEKYLADRFALRTTVDYEVSYTNGAVQAMNLDGGASSGIYLNGSYLVQPGRQLSNALIFVK